MDTSLEDFRRMTDSFCRRCYGFSIFDVTGFPLDNYFLVGHSSLQTAHAAARFRAQQRQN